MNSEKFAPMTYAQIMNAPKLCVYWGDLGGEEILTTAPRKHHALVNLSALPVLLDIDTNKDGSIDIMVDPNPKTGRDLALLWTLATDDLIYSSGSFTLWIEDYLAYQHEMWHGNEISISEMYEYPILDYATPTLESLEEDGRGGDRDALVLADRLRGIISGAVRW